MLRNTNNKLRHPGEGRDQALSGAGVRNSSFVPAFAGMTAGEVI
jgi:hypothetical protein